MGRINVYCSDRYSLHWKVVRKMSGIQAWRSCSRILNQFSLNLPLQTLLKTQYTHIWIVLLSSPIKLSTFVATHSSFAIPKPYNGIYWSAYVKYSNKMGSNFRKCYTINNARKLNLYSFIIESIYTLMFTLN